MEHKREFTGIFIPKEVLDNPHLTLVEKILLMEVHHLDGKDGCYATNEYLAKLLAVSVPTITRTLKTLTDKGYIDYVIDKTNTSGRALKSKISLFRVEGGNQNDYQRVTTNTTLTLPNQNDEPPFHEQAIEIYRHLYKHKFGEFPRITSYGNMVNMMKKLANSFTEAQAKALIFCHFEWRGISGKDDRAFESLTSAGFPLPWLLNNTQNYSVYMKQTLGEMWEKDLILANLVDGWCEKLFNGKK